MKELIKHNLDGLTEKELSYYEVINDLFNNEAFKNPKFKLLQLSAKLDYSTQNTSKLIKHIYGMSLMTLVNMYRVKYFDNQIKSYLSNGIKFNISQEIKETGFNNRTYFYYYFKEFMGKSPKEYYNL
jgi:AraC-like DNA-binding protein